MRALFPGFNPRMAVAAALFVSIATPAFAQQACAKRAVLLATLGDRYKEAPAAAGIAASGALVEVLTSADGSTWTIIVSLPTGTSCLLAAGQDWQELAKPVAGQGL